MAPDDVTKMVKDAGLRGRGGAGFSAGVKWSFLPKNHPGPIYLCVNADESEPGTFNNRILMEEDPHQLLEGHRDRLPCDSLAHGVHLSALRVRPQLPRARCGDPASATPPGMLGKNILGSGLRPRRVPASRRRRRTSAARRRG